MQGASPYSNSASPLEVLKDELQYNPQMAVQSIMRLRVIVVALGQERTHTELLPYLTSEIQQGNLNDEVLLAIADVLDSFVEFVSSREHVRCLLAPLRELCCIEDTAVRGQAVRAIHSIGRKLSAELVAPQLIPLVLGLGQQDDWFTPRVSACGLLPLAVGLSVATCGPPAPVSASSSANVSLLSSPLPVNFPGVTSSTASPRPISVASASPRPAFDLHDHGSPSAPQYSTSPASSVAAEVASLNMSGCGTAGGPTAELFALFHALSADSSVAVRQAAAASMCELAVALGSEQCEHAKVLDAPWSRLLDDEAEAVRVAALSASAAIAAAIPFGEGKPAALKLAEASRDRSPGVRLTLAEALPGVAQANNDAAAPVREMVATLVEDSEIDVRVAITMQAAALVTSLGAPFVLDSLLPSLDGLLRDESIDERVELARVLMGLARPLGVEDARSRLLPTMRLLLNDANTNVRLAVINGLEAMVHLMGADCARDDDDGGLLFLLSGLSADSNWRVRHATLLLLPTLAAVLEPAAFSAAFVTRVPANFEQRATDPCALIRRDWVRLCGEVAQLPTYSSAWLESDVLPVLAARHADMPGYQRRAVLLDGMATLAPHHRPDALEETLLPLALSMATDRVPNLRMLVASTLQAVAAHLSLDAVKSSVLPTLAELSKDADIDVLDAACAAVAVCSALVSG